MSYHRLLTFDEKTETITVSREQAESIGLILTLHELGRMTRAFRELCMQIGRNPHDIAEALSDIKALSDTDAEFAERMRLLRAVFDLAVTQAVAGFQA